MGSRVQDYDEGSDIKNWKNVIEDQAQRKYTENRGMASMQGMGMHDLRKINDVDVYNLDQVNPVYYKAPREDLRAKDKRNTTKTPDGRSKGSRAKTNVREAQPDSRSPNRNPTSKTGKSTKTRDGRSTDAKKSTAFDTKKHKKASMVPTRGDSRAMSYKSPVAGGRHGFNKKATFVEKQDSDSDGL